MSDFESPGIGQQEEDFVHSNKESSPQEKLVELGIPPGTFPEALFQDSEMLEFVIEQLPNIKSEAFMGSLTGHSAVRNELRGVQKESGDSKILFMAMDLAISLKKPALAKRIAVLADFDLEKVRDDVWNRFMMNGIHKHGWAYFYEVGHEFDISESKISKTLLISLLDELSYGGQKTVNNYKLYLQHVPEDKIEKDKITKKALEGVRSLLVSGKVEEAGEFVNVFELLPENVVSVSREAVKKLLNDSKYDEAVKISESQSLGDEFLSKQMSERYLDLLGSFSLVGAEKLQSAHGQYLRDIDSTTREQAISKGLIRKLTVGSPNEWIVKPDNQVLVSELPDSVLHNSEVLVYGCRLYVKELEKSINTANTIAEVLRIPLAVKEKFISRVIENYIKKKSLEIADLDSIATLVQVVPACRDMILDPFQQQRILELVKSFMASGRGFAKYMGLLNPEIQSELVFLQMNRALVDNNEREFKRLADAAGLVVFKNMRWSELKVCIKSFSFYEISKFPFLVSPLLNK